MLKQSHTILVVDDEPVSVLMLEKVLSRKFEVITAKSGHEALEILGRRTVSMLITDQRMPGMSGTELLRKSHTIDPDIVCMLITSENDAGTFIDALMHSGAIRVINKPWKPDQLLEVIEAALEKQETLSEAKKAMNQLKRASESLDRVVKG